MKTLKLSDLGSYSGIDCSNEISLFEYGLLCNITNLDDIHCYYGTGSNDAGIYDTFSCGSISAIEVRQLLNELNKADLLSFVGMSESDWLEMYVINQISDLLNYFGYQNIFGCSYNTFEIENN